MEATIGGTRRHLGQLAHHLGDHGIEVAVAYSARRTDEFRRDVAAMAAAGIETIEVPMARAVRPVADLLSYRRLRAVIRAGRFAVVHTHSSKAGALGRAAAPSRCGPALVHTPHSFAFLHDAEFSRLKRRLYMSVERFLGRRTARLVAVSRAEAEAAVRHRIVAADRVTVIANGVEADLASARPRDQVRAELGLAAGEHLVVSVGLLEVAKGHRYLIAALPAASAALPGLRCVIVGDGSRRRALEDQARASGLGERVIFTGQRGDALDLIAAADAMVLPSLWEGLPYVVLEAMALAVPVIAADVGGCAELVEPGGTGMLVPAADASALAAAIVKLLGDPDAAAAMGRRGRERARTRFSLDAMVSAHARLYEALA
jgi:glycosyltransferase involved in cell wall biosynthesis